MINSESAEYLNQAKSFLKLQQYEDALDYLDKAISIDKINKELYIYKAIVFANLGKYDDSKETLQKALLIDKEYSEAYFHMGNILLMTGNKAQGIENYNKAIAYGFDDAQVFYNLGLMYEEDDNDELALRNYTKAIKKDPMRIDARVRKANLYIKHKKNEEALETLNELILVDPDLYDGYHLKSLLLAEMGNYDEAFDVLENAIDIFPKDPAFVLDKINILVMSNDTEKAEKCITELEENYEMKPDQKHRLELEKARLYALRADLDKVIDSLIGAKNIYKEMKSEEVDAEATFLLANCYLEKKDYQSAAEYAQELLKCAKTEYLIPAYYILPFSYAKMGMEEKSKEQYKDSISKLRMITLNDPGILDGYLFRALCLKEVGQYEKALELSDYLLRVDQNSKTFHDLKAEVLFAMGREEEAIAEKEKVKI